MSSTDPVRPRLIGVGTAVPPVSYTQDRLLDIFGIADAKVRGVFMNGGIRRRHLSLAPAGADGRPGPESQGDLLRKHVAVGVEIGRAALDACLAEAGATRADVRYLCCVSSTGFITPGLSALLIKELGLATDCARLDVVGMGCNAGLNGLAAVAGWTGTHPGSLAVMLCVEVCSATYVFDGTMRSAVVNSLFGDGAAALAVVAGEDGAGPVVLRSASRIIPEAVDAMRYDWDEHFGRFSFYLDPDIPYVIGAHAEGAIQALLHGTGLHRSDIAHWVVHSGGRKVIDAVRVNLGLTRHDLRHTLDVLRDYGNLSSGSFLFSYRNLVRERAPEPGEHAVAMTMGPGSTIEAALLRW
ncbi:3,5-dihydroxyphenylacetyl-CoA synthase DpgA [Dactylosporangium sp. NPDC051485]|uniref:3,5-dihydroxyphenylacetyl-CoA synthase DpgA n=1 Tax=Dactylosporangium sp. NPDC051485 TaxID=3154846 RepID=UPI00343E32FD